VNDIRATVMCSVCLSVSLYLNLAYSNFIKYSSLPCMEKKNALMDLSFHSRIYLHTTAAVTENLSFICIIIDLEITRYV
jgi:hypothetical protein